jgi:protease PrsW
MHTTLAATAIHLECIDGKDDHFIVELFPGDKKVFGGFEDESITRLKELENHGGVIIVSNENGVLKVDATDCAVPVKINGQIIAKASLKTKDILKIGNTIWKSINITEQIENTIETGKTSLTKGFGNILGLDELRDFKLSSLFSEVFKKHSLAETEEQLVTGTSKNTPSLTDIEISWAKPWLFSRIIIGSVILVALLTIGFTVFQNSKLVPGLIFIGTFVMPLATVIFFMEVNAPRNISIFLLTVLLFIGGVASMLMTLLISNNMEWLYMVFETSGAAVIEEPAKILILVLVVGKFVRYKWILNGLLLGSAVGAGFGAFESAGYAFDASRINDFSGMVDNIIVRGLLAPFMHVVWTANAAAALWIVKGDKPFSWDMLIEGRFLRVFLLSIATHFTWNADFSIMRLPYVVDVKYLLLGLLSWTVCFMLIQAGLKQLNQARHAEIERLSAD